MQPLLDDGQLRLQGLVRLQLAAVVPEDPDAVLHATAQFGLIDLVVAREAGGLELGQSELCLVHEELGARLADARFVRGALLLFDLCTLCERSEGTGQLVERLRSATPTVDASPLLGCAGSAGAGSAGAGSAGTACPAELVVVAGERRGGTPRRLHVLDRATAAGTPAGTAPATTAGIAWVEPGGQGATLARAHDRDRLRSAAHLVGVARHALVLARTRAATRRLGGRPLVERQAIAHLLARAALRLELARVEVAEAAWRHDQDDRSGRARALVLTALALAAGAATGTTRVASQVYGAAGTSDPAVVDAYRTAHALAVAWGSSERLWRAAADRAQVRERR
jgi:alkylation response protein AidB-like acyl-CoA dehydrogenase